MTVAPSSVETVYALTGTNLGPFATGWPYAGHADISVHLTVDDVARLLFEGADYTVTGATPLATGGTVTLSAALVGSAWPAGATLCLTRASQTGQPTALGDAVGFSPKVAEAALDFLERQIQDVWGPLVRAMAKPPGAADYDARGARIINLADGVSLTDAASLGQARALAAAPLAAIAAFLAGQTVAHVKIMFSSAFPAFPGEPDDTGRLQRLFDAAGPAGFAVVEPGDYHLSATLNGYNTLQIIGAGGNCTKFWRTGAYGDTIKFVNCGAAKVSGIWFIHGALPANTSAAFANRLTDGSAHLNFLNGQDWTVSDCWFYRMPYGVRIGQGARFNIDRCSFTQVWDPAQVAYQEGIAGIVIGIDGYSQIGQVTGNYFGGVPSAVRSTTWTASDGALTAAMANSCGAQVGVQIYQCEDLIIEANYFGGQSLNNILGNFQAAAVAIEWRIAKNFFDGAGLHSAMIQVTTSSDGIMLNGLSIEGNHFNGEQISFQAMQFLNASGGTQPAVTNFAIKGNTSMATVGSFCMLYNARGGVISGNSITSYNSRNISPGADVTFCAAVWGSAVTTGVLADGNTVGGGINNAAPASYCYQTIVGVGVAERATLWNGAGPGGTGVGIVSAKVAATTDANYQLTGYEDEVEVFNNTINTAILPPANPAVRYQVTLKDAAGTWATHTCQFSGTVDGVANPTYSTNKQSVKLQYVGGGAWRTV